jgi:glycosyltransferase involved in cell wall biosynthesis
VKSPLLTIIIPAYNAAAHLESLCEDILSESFNDFELIIVDDGSTDETFELAKKIASKDSRVIALSRKNGGPAAARNTGIKKARGKYVQFFDVDDGIVTDSLGKNVLAIESLNADIVVSGWSIVDKRLGKEKIITPKKETIDADKIRTFVIWSLGEDGLLYNLWNKLFKLEIIKKNQIRFDESLRFGEDLLFGLEYFKYANKLIVISEITYRYTKDSATSVFRSSSLIPAFRQKNDKAIRVFAEPISSQYDVDRLNWLRLRWLFSYWCLVQKSHFSRYEKKQLLKFKLVPQANLSKKSLSVSRNKRVVATIMKLIKDSPSIILFIAMLANFTKSLTNR